MKDSKQLTGNNIDGVLNIFKEPGYTSHDVVAILRKILKTKKIGHAGTLDPNVSGVLPICIGKATKISQYLMDFGKTYVAEITFGIETDTEDIWGNITKTDNMPVNFETFEKVLSKYNNIEIKQIPPMYSAIKVNGKRLYELAYKGITIDRKERNAKIYKTKILRKYKNKVILEVSCSKGTYIRTLIKDICIESGTIGTMSNLLRIESGGLNISNSLTLDQIKYFVYNGNYDYIISIENALHTYEKFNLSDKYFKKIINGVKIDVGDFYTDKLLLIYCSNEFIGLGSINRISGSNYLKMKNMFYRGTNENN
ncbi:tRNA pseudouridine(55) synthase TruB [Miniphocaeibacter halophilus]|uniref:tRNA pseudouridine(55) synthase TruB n=1 Tax=Miniphocaeibacter halophilus TaxID=2931922 RepID=A0AC61N0I9_9FIRM|nr:tRNA pseudouridine(55) synthase TruB [Miniphocaeibacter halophilus]QQK07628.1 tRNA pseudouridine(55) synthase TruB [Miniphocaeibacter halophilus]